MTTSAPKGWITATALEVCEKIQDGTHFSPKVQLPHGEHPYVTAKNVRPNGLDLSNLTFLRDEDHQKIYARCDVRKNDVLLVKDGVNTGDVAINTVEEPISLLSSVCFLRPIPGLLSPHYLRYYLQSPHGYESLTGRMSGTAIRRIILKRIKETPVTFPGLLTQRRIVDALDSYLSRLDDAVAGLERAHRSIERYRASVLLAAVEGRLVPTEAELARAEGRRYEAASVVLDQTEAPPRPNRWKSRSKDIIMGHAAMAVGNARSRLPEGWAWSALVDIAKMESGHTPSRRHPEWWQGDVPWIGIADARKHNGRTINVTYQHTNSDGLANSAARLLPAGTVCVSRTASVGYVVVMGRAMATSQDFVNWVPTSAVTSDWLRVIFSADRDALLRFGKGTVHKTIYFPEWLSVHVAVPPVPEQLRITAEVDQLLSVADELDALLAANLRRYERLRQSILRWAFEGKLVDQDPSDEPAAILLERLRKSRGADGEQAMTRRRRRGRARG